MIEEKTDYNGHDVKISKKKKNQQECADFSASTPGGHFWTWNKTSKTCFVKSSNSGKNTVGHAVSGNSKCGKGKIPQLFSEWCSSLIWSHIASCLKNTICYGGSTASIMGRKSYETRGRGW